MPLTVVRLICRRKYKKTARRTGHTKVDNTKYFSFKPLNLQRHHSKISDSQEEPRCRTGTARPWMHVAGRAAVGLLRWSMASCQRRNTELRQINQTMSLLSNVFRWFFPPQCKSFRKIEIRKNIVTKINQKPFCPKSPHPHDDVTGIWSDIAQRGIPSDMKLITDTSHRKKENRKREHISKFKRLFSLFLLQTESSIPVLPHQADFSPESCSKDKK